MCNDIYFVPFFFKVDEHMKIYYLIHNFIKIKCLKFKINNFWECSFRISKKGL